MHRCSVYRNPGTGRVVPWRFKVGDDEVDQPVVPALCTNDELLELNAVLAGKVIGQLAGVTAAPYIRAGQLVPLLVDLMPDRYSYFVYYGSRNAQPARVRAFVDLVLERLVDQPAYVLSARELKLASRGKLHP
jgi:DNA-binding transcriptional LysR family regulator